jgi:hypothetical protein
VLLKGNDEEGKSLLIAWRREEVRSRGGFLIFSGVEREWQGPRGSLLNEIGTKVR